MANAQPLFCPKCRANKIKDNKGHDHSGNHAGHATHAAHHMGGAGLPMMLAAAAAGWLLGKAERAMKDEWKCESCHHEFSRSAGGCLLCTSTTNMYHTKCCQIKLCEPCVQVWAKCDSWKCVFCGVRRS